MGELLPCPFCGSNAKLGGIRDGQQVFCTGHRCFARGPAVFHGPGGWEACERDAITAWNTRPRTEGRGEGEPVAWRYRWRDRMYGAMAEWSAEVDHDRAVELAGKGGEVEPLYASPIREPEISRAKRDEIARIIDPEIFADLDLVASQAPQFIPSYSGQRNVDAAYAKADAILNLAHVGGRGEGWRPTHRHVKRGSDYQPLKPAILQTEAPLADGAALLVYRDEAGAWWARTPEEFNDGRFQPLPPPPQEQGGMK